MSSYFIFFYNVGISNLKTSKPVSLGKDNVMRVIPACKFSANCSAFKYLREKKKANVLSQGWCLDNVRLKPRHAVLSVLWLVLNGTALHREILLILSVGAF